MKIIVFGATGKVGSRVVAEALSRDHEYMESNQQIGKIVVRV